MKKIKHLLQTRSLGIIHVGKYTVIFNNRTIVFETVINDLLLVSTL